MAYSPVQIGNLKRARKTVTKTDKRKGAYVLTSEQVDILEAAGLTLRETKPAPIITVKLIGEEIREITASYYLSVRKGSGRTPEPRMGRQFISEWLQIGDAVTLATDGQTLFAFRERVVGKGAMGPPSQSRNVGELGVDYKPADEKAAIGTISPIHVEPAVVERGIRGHATTQNALARYLRRKNLTPRSPRSDDPDFDLAWEAAGKIYVAEIKSLTEKNEESQLRLALGQVLQYRHQLKQLYGVDVVAVLAAESQTSQVWIDICAGISVPLVWPDDFSALESY